MRVAETRAALLESWGNEVVIVRASTVADIANALVNNGEITGGVILIGHGGQERFSGDYRLSAFFVGEGSGASTNLDLTNVGKLNNRMLGPNAVIEIDACNSASPGSSTRSIGRLVANQLQRFTYAYTGDIRFASSPNTGSWKIPATGPLYMVPVHGRLTGISPDYH
jgi:hypothetical protein